MLIPGMERADNFTLGNDLEHSSSCDLDSPHRATTPG